MNRWPLIQALAIGAFAGYMTAAGYSWRNALLAVVTALGCVAGWLILDLCKAVYLRVMRLSAGRL